MKMKSTRCAGAHAAPFFTPRNIACAGAAVIALASAAEPASAQLVSGTGSYGFIRSVTYTPSCNCYAPVISVPGVPWGGINPYGNNFWTVTGPSLGAGTAAALNAYGVPGPISSWAGSRVEANTWSADRENGALNQGARVFTGVSVRDIQQYGPLGGRCSFFNNPFGGNGC